MKKTLLMVFAVVLVIGMSGCCGPFARHTCSKNSCNQGGCGLGQRLGCGGGQGLGFGGQAYGGAYPYYTFRGPRDFLVANPRPIGP